MRAPWREQQRFDAAISSLLSNIGHLIVSNRRDAEKRVNEEHAFREKSKNWMEGWESMALGAPWWRCHGPGAGHDQA